MASVADFGAETEQVNPIDRLEPSHCPDCLGTRLSNEGPCQAPVELKNDGLRFAAEVRTRLKSSSLYECRNCRMLFRFPQLSTSELEALYKDLPGNYWSDEAGANVAWSLTRDYLLAHFTGVSRPAVLDVGAFNGGFLKSLPREWHKSAVEPSTEARQSLIDAGVEVIGRFLNEEDLSSHQGKFDAVTMLDVLEHLECPSVAVKTLASLLKPGGLLLISTGNAHHWSWRLLKGNHWYLHSIQHCSFASRPYLHRLISPLNLKIKRLIRHGHQRVRQRERFRQSIDVIFAWGRSNSGWLRKISGFLVYIPGLGYLKHMRTAPYSMGLHDHFLIVLDRG